VGFFVPALVALFAVDQLATDHFTPDAYRDASTGAQIAILGGAAVVMCILFSGLNYRILRLFEGYSFQQGCFKKLADKRRERWRRKYDELEKRRQGAAGSGERTKAALELNSSFPAKRENVLPSRFGNALRSFETHPSDNERLRALVEGADIEGLGTSAHSEAPGEQVSADNLNGVSRSTSGV
jgi:hypothetical protein